MIADNIFEGKSIRLAEVDAEQDYPIESAWSYDLDYARHFRKAPARPLTAAELKKYYEKLFKETQEKGQCYHFALRLKDDNRLVGFLRFWVFEWNHATGLIEIGIGEKDLRCSLLPEVLNLAMVYAFDELNLHRVSVHLPAYDFKGIEMLEAAGFQLEVRRKESMFHAGRYWDWLHYGLLGSDWRKGEGR